MNIFDFSGRENVEATMRRTWEEFRQALADGCFSYDETDKAKEYEYVKTFDDILFKHSGVKHLTVRLCALFSSNNEVSDAQ